MANLPAIHVFSLFQHRQSWMAGPSPAMTQEQWPRGTSHYFNAYAAQAGHDDEGALPTSLNLSAVCCHHTDVKQRLVMTRLVRASCRGTCGWGWPGRAGP
jgi:hypothetical protein